MARFNALLAVSFMVHTACADAAVQPPHPGCGTMKVQTRASNLPLSRLLTNGPCIVDQSGESIRLTGVNIADPEHINQKRAGTNAIKVIEYAARHLGANAVRAPILPGDGITGFFTDSDHYLKEVLDPLVAAAGKEGIYLIIEFHLIDDYHRVKDDLFRFWQMVAPRYADRSHVIYDIMNEPIGPDEWRRWRDDVAQPLVDVIRKLAPETLIIVPGTYWALNLEGLLSAPIQANHIVYAVHLYPGNFTQERRDQYDQVIQHYPLIVSEWGYDAAGQFPIVGTKDTYGHAIVNWMDQRQLSWLAWVLDPVWQESFVDHNWRIKADDFGAYVQELLSAQTKPSIP